jgi:hypothetical protein
MNPSQLQELKMILECEIDIADNMIPMLTDMILKQKNSLESENTKQAEQEVIEKMYWQCYHLYDRFTELVRNGLSDEKLHGM